MNPVLVWVLAAAITLFHFWASRRKPKYWYLGGIVPALWLGALVFLFANGKIDLAEDWRMLVFHAALDCEMGKENLVTADPDVIFVVYMAYSGRTRTASLPASWPPSPRTPRWPACRRCGRGGCIPSCWGTSMPQAPGDGRHPGHCGGPLR